MSRINSIAPGLVLVSALLAGAVQASDVVGVHRWYAQDSGEPAISVSTHDSLEGCRESLRQDVRSQQAEWEGSDTDYRFRFSSHDCFDTAGGVPDDARHFWVSAEQIFWVNPAFISDQCEAAGGDTALCSQVSREFIEANRSGNAIGHLGPGRPF